MAQEDGLEDDTGSQGATAYAELARNHQGHAQRTMPTVNSDLCGIWGMHDTALLAQIDGR
jgi:hypothetical protein